MRINVNGSTITGVDAPHFPGEYSARVVMRREADGTYTVLEATTFVATSRQERECIAAGCFGCMNCS